MNVAELITHLQQLPPDALILIPGYEGGYNTPDAPEAIEVVHQPDAAWYYGRYEKSTHYTANADAPRIQAYTLGNANG